MKQNIEIEVPEGYEVVGYGIPVHGDYFMDDMNSGIVHRCGGYSWGHYRIILKKKLKNRWMFVATGEIRSPKEGEWFECDDGDIVKASCDHVGGFKRILVEVED